MLGKLMKYEWSGTWKLLLPANLLIVVTSFFACIMVRQTIFDYDDGAVMLTILVTLTYIVSMILVFVGTAIYLIYHFYTTTYGDQGYLLHTLPVDKHQIIIAKALVSAAWILISSFIMYMSVVFLLNFEGNIYEDFIEALDLIIVTRTDSGAVSVFATMMTLIALIVGIFVRVLKAAACISLGQLSSNHKLLVSFAYYFAIYIIQQLVNTCYIMLLGVVGRKRGTWSLDTSWEFVLISGLIYVVVFYLLTWHVMDKRLNLD